MGYRSLSDDLLSSPIPVVVDRGTDPICYLAEGFGLNAFVLDEGLECQTSTTTVRGVEFQLGYYPILDRTPRGRDEGEGSSYGSNGTTSTDFGERPASRCAVRYELRLLTWCGHPRNAPSAVNHSVGLYMSESPLALTCQFCTPRVRRFVE